jgi:hypothetical protein
MDDESRPVEPQDGHGTDETGKDARGEHGTGVPAGEQSAKSRAAYLDPRGSESTRELRDTARRRRDAEEKLQQHLMEAKDHVPNEFHEHPGHGYVGHGHEGHEHPAHEPSGHETPDQEQPGQEQDSRTGETGADKP